MPSKKYYRFFKPTSARTISRGVDRMFAWTLFFLLLVGFTLFCWIGSFYIVGHPEKAANYRLLKRLHKLEDPQRFQITAAPRGEFLKPLQLLERFGEFSPLEIKRFNEGRLRDFLRNYHQTRELLPYITGDYTIIGVRVLTEKNIFSPGVAALLQSTERPEIFVEEVFPCDIEHLSLLEQKLVVGTKIKFEKSVDLSALLFVKQREDGGLQLTAIPILYGTYGKRSTSETLFSLEPPEEINIAGTLPIFSKNELMAAATAAQSSLLAANGEQEEIALKREKLSNPRQVFSREKVSSSPLPTSSLNHQKTRSSKNSDASFAEDQRKEAFPRSSLQVTSEKMNRNNPMILPAIPLERNPQEKPILQPQQPQQSPTLSSNSPLISSNHPAQSTSSQRMDQEAIPQNPPAAAPQPTSLDFSSSMITTAPTSSAESLSPTNNLKDLSTNQITSSTNSQSTNSKEPWPLYESGKIPRGRILEPEDFPALANEGLNGERLYIEGDFSVTASGDHRAVLRYQPSNTELPMAQRSKIRIVVDYPPGILPPAEGISITQDRLHPLMLTDVKKEKDGTLNLYVREIVATNVSEKRKE